MMGLGSGISAIGNRFGDWYNGNQRKKAPSVTTTPVKTVLQVFPPCEFCQNALHPARHPLVLACKHLTCQSCAQKNVYGEVIKCPKCNEPTILDDTKGTDNLDSLQWGEKLPDTPDFEDVPLNPKASLDDMPFVGDDAPICPEQTDYTDAAEEGFVIVRENLKIIPDYYIPFTQRKESCKPLISHWLTNIWFPPSDLYEKKEEVDPHPYYVPFYVFSVITQTHWGVEVGTTNEKKEVHWNRVENNFSSQYEQLVVCASSGFHPKLVDLLLNGQKGFSMNTDKVIPSEPLKYNPDVRHENNEAVLPIDLNHVDAFNQFGGVQQISKWEKKTAQKLFKDQHKPEQSQNFTSETQIFSKKHYLILLPIFQSGFSYGGKTYEALISGNKGVVVGNRPFGTGIIGKVCMDAFNTVSTMVGESI